MKALNKGHLAQLASYLAESMGELCYGSMAEAKQGLAAWGELRICFEDELDDLREWGAEELPSYIGHAAINAGLLNAELLEAAYNMAYANSMPAILASIEANGIS